MRDRDRRIDYDIGMGDEIDVTRHVSDPFAAEGPRPVQAPCHLGLGKLYVKLDRQEQARTVLSCAIELYHAMDMTFWLPQAEAAMASPYSPSS
jgi:hypothetical protein